MPSVKKSLEWPVSPHIETKDKIINVYFATWGAFLNEFDFFPCEFNELARLKLLKQDKCISLFAVELLIKWLLIFTLGYLKCTQPWGHGCLRSNKGLQNKILNLKVTYYQTWIFLPLLYMYVWYGSTYWQIFLKTAEFVFTSLALAHSK